MVEVVVAALILTLGSLAVLSLVGASARSTYRSEQSQVISDRLQQEMESIKALADTDYAQVALTGLPADTPNTSSPAWRVSGTNYAIAQNGSQTRPLVYNGSALDGGGTVSGGVINPAPTPFTSGDVSGTIFRYVVWENDPNCPETSCPGSQDLKRIIVAMVLSTTASGGVRHYQELQAQISDPEAQPVDNENPTPPPTGTASTWLTWLTDTPCNNTGRQDITADHLTHNTNGVCSAGTKDASNCTTVLLATSCPAGAPDLMFPQGATLADEQTPLFDYATDVEPTQNPDQDKGLQMMKPTSNGCLSSLFQPLTNISGALVGDPDPTRMQTIHKWVTNTIPSGFNVQLDGNGTLDLWTQSINAASYSGKICVWLFERHLNVLGVPVDTPAVNLDLSNLTYFTYAQNPWPTEWTEIHIPLHFTLNAISPNSRLGLAIQVERAGTSGGGMQFMYDEPSFDSRLELHSTSAIPCGTGPWPACPSS